MQLLATTSTVLDTNCFVVAPDTGGDAVVVDPGAGSAGALRELLDAHELRVGAVVLTHGHADHLWDAAEVAGAAPVYLASPDHYRLDDPAAALGEPLGSMFTGLAATGWQRPATAAPFPAGCLREGGAELVPGVVVRAVPAPGHTEGSTILLVRGDMDAPDVLPELPGAAPAAAAEHLVAFCGDVIFAGSVGRTDLPGGDEREMAATLRTLVRALPPSTVLLPGHGPGTVLSHELATNPHLRS
ncbi:MBL fold metallo-hydrolase [Georgenia subflava]|uniref:MBL fold metallo-hydrolase n=1 Tax=Georgenia subflava TaxID=1622177 RepID=A0A6N7ELK7_9MICO|nr:MBL fold metallo-hydrolase [Georgenia subflava]MPV37727.1 MBL fold metallo-hydrolase [Georgenia subflava]